MGPVVCPNIPTYKTLQRIEKILLNSQAYLMALHKFQEGRLDFAFRQVQRLFFAKKLYW